MAPAVASTQSNNGSGTTLVITKPTGLAVGDLMVCVASACRSAGAATIDTLSGWTSAVSQSGNDSLTKIQYKIADSGDVAASNFTFTTGSTTLLSGGTILRITGFPSAAPIYSQTSGNFNGTATTTISITSTLNVDYNNSLLILGLSGVNQGTDGAGNMSGYVASDGSLSWTELHDYGSAIGTRDPIFGAAYAIQSTAASITSFGATLSLARVDHTAAIIAIIPTANATGSNALHAVSPTIFAQNGTSGATGTNALLQPQPFLPNQSGSATERKWTNQTKSSSPTWTNIEKN